MEETLTETQRTELAKLQTTAVLDYMRAQNFDPPLVDGLERDLAAINIALAGHRLALRELSLQNHVPEVRAEQHKQLTEGTRRKIEPLRTAVSRHDETLFRLSGQIPPVPVAEDALAFLRQSELRTEFRQIDPLDRGIFFLEACERGSEADEILIAAALGASRIRPLISDETKEAGLALRAKRLNPEAASQIEQLQRVRLELSSALEVALAELGD